MSLFKYRTLIHCAALMSLMLALTGCDKDSEKAHLHKRVDELSVKLDSLMDALELQRENDSVTIDESSLMLLPGDSNAFIKTEVGFLTARLDSFRDFGSGSRVNFKFGNPGSVTLKGMRARLEWVVINAKGDTEVQQAVRYEFLEDLQPGVLAKINVVLDDLPANRAVGVRISRVRFQEIAFKAKESATEKPKHK